MHDNEGDMIINPHEADTVRFIFQSVLNGIGTEKIADILETRKIPTRKGGKWTSSSIRTILSNEKNIMVQLHFRKHIRMTIIIAAEIVEKLTVSLTLNIMNQS